MALAGPNRRAARFCVGCNHHALADLLGHIPEANPFLQSMENYPMSQDLFAVVVAAVVFTSGIAGLVYHALDPRNEQVNETRDLINR